MHLLLSFGSSFSLPVWEEKTLCYIVCYISFLPPNVLMDNFFISTFFHSSFRRMHLWCLWKEGDMLVCESSLVISDFLREIWGVRSVWIELGTCSPKPRIFVSAWQWAWLWGGFFVGLGTKLPQSKSLQLQRTWLAWENVQLRNHSQARDDEGLWF